MYKGIKPFQNWILLLLLIFMALPAPREAYSILFKLYTIGFFFILITFLLDTINKKRIRLPRFAIMFPFFLIPVIFTVLGFYKGNDSYYILRELFLFSLPLMTFIIIINCSENIESDNLIKMILWTAVIAAAFLLTYEICGLLFQYKTRVQFRFEYVSRNIGFLTFAYILYLFKTDRIIGLFWPGFLVIISSLILTMGRLQWITICVFTAILIMILSAKLSRFIKAVILIAFLVAPVLNLGYLLKYGESLKDKSILWRQLEAKTVIENIKKEDINPYIGNGLGYSFLISKPLTLYRGESLAYIQRVHNIFLYMMVKMGVLGMMAFLVAYVILANRFYTRWTLNNHNSRYFLLTSYFLFILFVDGSITGHFIMNVNSGMELGLVLALMEKIS